MADIHQDITHFTADRAWGARDLAEIAGATVRLHWTDKPYIWHTNTGAEVFFAVFILGVIVFFFGQKLQRFQRRHTGFDHYEGFEIQDALKILQRHIHDQTDA